MDNKPALNLFESIEPNGTVELEGLGTVNLSHFPYREDHGVKGQKVCPESRIFTD